MNTKNFLILTISLLSIAVIALLGVGGYLLINKTDLFESPSAENVLNDYLTTVVNEQRFRDSLKYLTKESRAKIRHRNLLEDPSGLNKHYYAELRERTGDQNTYSIKRFSVQGDTALAEVQTTTIDYYTVRRTVLKPVVQSATRYLVREGLFQMIQSDTQALEEDLQSKIDSKRSEWNQQITDGFIGNYSDGFPKTTLNRNVHLVQSNGKWRVDLTEFVEKNGVLSFERNDQGEVTSLNMHLSVNPMLNEFIVDDRFYSLIRERIKRIQKRSQSND